MKRIVSLILAMLVCLMPMSGFAEAAEERLAERDREYAAWAGERGKPHVRDFRPKDIQGIANEDLRRWY